ncbi:MAG TPA: RNA 2',3'-cyclic phosphodiesterase [Ktedonobacterales bacterium]|nr:RNA 2',3'-cyclic phosphodiesterase [Ktedonobacterales bacterium]
MTRTFIAIDLNDEARGYLHQQVQKLSRLLPRVRWVDPESLHLTLAFLGELDDAQLEQASQATLETAQAVRPFIVRVGVPGIFGPPQNPRVIWLGLAGDLQPLLGLQATLAGRLAQKGFPPEERAYAPHLTLARIKSPLSQQELVSLRRILPPAASDNHRSGQPPPKSHQTLPEIPVAHLSVMKSELTRAGSQYTRLHLCPFAE